MAVFGSRLCVAVLLLVVIGMTSPPASGNKIFPDKSDFGRTLNLSPLDLTSLPESETPDLEENMADDGSETRRRFGPSLTYLELFPVSAIPHSGDGPLVYHGPATIEADGDVDRYVAFRPNYTTDTDDAVTPNYTIIGGSTARIFNHPYQVAILTRIRGFFAHICGGSLLSRNKVVTAAHCVNERRTVYVMMGVSDLTDIWDPYMQFIQVTKIERYEYSRNRDIAILTLKSRARLNYRTQTIDIGRRSDTATIALCTVSGWGRRRFGRTTVLRATRIRIMNWYFCNASLIFQGLFFPVGGTHVCGENIFSNVCTGDDGGPLVCQGRLAGIVSWVGRGCPLWSPVVFTRVARFRNWINNRL